jgi:hypothetical protein
VIGLGELSRDSASYVRTYPFFRLRIEQEVPGGFNPKGGLVLGGAEGRVERHPVAHAGPPGPDRSRSEEGRPSGRGGDLPAPLVSDLRLKRAGVQRQGDGGEPEKPAHAVRSARAAR